MATPTVRTVEPGITIVELSGRLYMGHGLAEAEEELLGLIRNGVRKLIVDLSALNYIDSAGLGMLTGCRNQMTAAGGQIRLAGPQGATARVFKVIRMDKIMPVDPDVAAAQAALA